MRYPAILAALVVIVTACGGGSSTSGPTGGSSTEPPTSASSGGGGEGEPTPGTSLTSCELITAADIEAALGLDAGTVSEGQLTQSGTVLDPAVNECKYQDDDWGGLIVHVTPTDGVNTWDALVSAFGEDAEEVQSIGDGALWFEKNTRAYFIKGSVEFFVQFTFLKTTSDFKTPSIAVGTAAIAKL